MSEDSSSDSFNLSGVKYDSDKELALVSQAANSSFLDSICYDEAYEYNDYFSFVKDLPNEILVNIFAQLCFKDLCMTERGSLKSKLIQPLIRQFLNIF
jgi:hypothetical protein